MSNNFVNRGFVNKLFSTFPFLEIAIRIIYWKNIFFFNFIYKRFLFLRRFKNKRANIEQIDFSEIVSFLKDYGISHGDTLLVHSSYDSIKQSRKLPKEIIDDLLNLVGSDGNLVMPANRVFDYNKEPIEFDVKRTRVWSGALPFAMLLRKDCEKSRFPINSVVVIGKDAKDMVADNLTEDFSTPCGLNSAWYQCYLKDAYVLGLGIDLTHSLTMTHVAEDAWESDWPIADWYENKQYQITDANFKQLVNVRQRRDKWGKFYFAERKLAKDLNDANILKTFIVQGVDIQLVKSQELINFLRSRNKMGYPFYGIKRFIKRNDK
jgi:aminoglycoside 3-N-acetyltransferase